MKRYMLDTNIVSHFLKQHPAVTAKVVSTEMSSLCISAITAGELQFGLAKRPEAKQLHLVINEFLRRVDTLPWDTKVTATYGQILAELSQTGKMLAPLDLLIAAHVKYANTILVTNDQAFNQVSGLKIEDWTI